MKIEEQVCTLEQGKALKSLNINQGSYFRWLQFRNESSPTDQWSTVHTVLDKEDDMMEYYERKHLKSMEDFPALTVAELGVMLPNGYDTMRITSNENVSISVWQGYDDNGNDFSLAPFKTEAECRAAMLIYMLENNLITPAEVNERLKYKQ